MSSTMITARIPEALSEKLDDIARDSQRSRSWIVKEALEHYLTQKPEAPEYRDIMSFAGAGVKFSKRRTTEEVDAEIRWLRGDD